MLGLQRRGARAWTPAEDQELGRLWRRGGELAQLGRRLGRSPAALRLRAVKLGLASYARRWTRQEDAQLMRLAEHGTCLEQAAGILARTPAGAARPRPPARHLAATHP